MSGSYFVLKMLREQRTKRHQQLKNVRNSYSKLKKSNYKHQNTKCRICLNEGFIPIYGAEQLSFDLPDAIKTIGGVEVKEDDIYPKHLCGDCHSLLKGAVLFRKSARESDEILRQTTATAVTPVLSEDDTGNDTEPAEKLIGNQHKYNTKKHKNVRVQCRICMKLLTPKLYEKHLLRHQSASHLVCDVCGKLYRKDNLLRHLQLHSNDLPFQCQTCPYRGRFMESLKIHMRTHSGDKPFSCDKCELRFITRSNLNRHLLTHDKEKPFKCHECSRGFYTQRDLDIHSKADHAGIKEFDCQVCGNKYGTRKALMRHELRVHKRDKMAKGRMPLYLQAEFQNGVELML